MFDWIVSVIYVLCITLTEYSYWVVSLVAVAFLCGVIPVAFYTLMERRVMAAVQRRVGPNVVGFWGVLQPVADGVKLMAKEHVMPRQASVALYYLAPVISISISYVTWFYMPLGIFSDFETEFGVFVLFAISALSSYGVVLAGWASYSRYAVMGALRAIAQLISYEVVLLLMVFPVAIFSGSYRLGDIVAVQGIGAWFIFTCLPAAAMFYVIILAETNRTPFDLPEAEAELVSGFNVEYSSMLFAMFSLAEYNSMLVMSSVFSILFLGGWSDSFFTFKVILVAVSLVFVRALLPRYRYDQLMALCWRVFLPAGLGFLLFVCGWACATEAFIVDAGCYASAAFLELSMSPLATAACSSGVDNEGALIACYMIYTAEPARQNLAHFWGGMVDIAKTNEDVIIILLNCPNWILLDLPYPNGVSVDLGIMSTNYSDYRYWANIVGGTPNQSDFLRFATDIPVEFFEFLPLPEFVHALSESTPNNVLVIFDGAVGSAQQVFSAGMLDPEGYPVESPVSASWYEYLWSWWDWLTYKKPTLTTAPARTYVR